MALPVCVCVEGTVSYYGCLLSKLLQTEINRSLTADPFDSAARPLEVTHGLLVCVCEVRAEVCVASSHFAHEQQADLLQ